MVLIGGGAILLVDTSFCGGGMHFDLEEGIIYYMLGEGYVHFDLKEGVYIIWSRGSHTTAGGSRKDVF